MEDYRPNRLQVKAIWPSNIDLGPNKPASYLPFPIRLSSPIQYSKQLALVTSPKGLSDPGLGGLTKGSGQL